MINDLITLKSVLTPPPFPSHHSHTNASRTNPLAQSKGKVVRVRASLRATINSSDGRTVRLVSSKLNTLSVERISINIVQRVVNHSCAVRGSPYEFGSVGRVVVAVLGETVAVSLALEFLAVVASLCGELLLGRGLVLTGDGEEDVLRAVVLDGGLAGEGGGGKSEDAGGGEGGEVHDCGVGSEKLVDVVWSGCWSGCWSL
jgi:hypothetical protein